MYKKLLLLFALAFLSTTPAFSQEEDTVNVTTTPWYFTFNFDYNFGDIYGRFYDQYSGEYFDNSHYTWKTVTQEDKKFFDNTKFYNPKFDLMVSKWRFIRFGLSYNTGYIQKARLINGTTTTEDYIYLAIAPIVEYQYHFKKDYDNSPFLYTTASAGTYRSADNMEGAGMEIFTQMRLGAGYEYKGYMAKAYISYDNTFYRESTASPIFNKAQSIKTDLNLVYFGFGIAKEFGLKPDVKSKW